MTRKEGECFLHTEILSLIIAGQVGRGLLVSEERKCHSKKRNGRRRKQKEILVEANTNHAGVETPDSIIKLEAKTGRSAPLADANSKNGLVDMIVSPL